MKNLLLICSALFLLSCGNSKTSVEQIAQQERLKQMVESKDYRIESDWAMPQANNSLMQIQNSGLLGPGNTAGNINLIGNPNFLSIKGDSIKAQLPYFGERRMGGGYGNQNVGIELDGLVEDYSAEWNDKKRRYVIKFQTRNDTEQYLVIINLFPNNNSNMMINGFQRTPIQYTGSVMPSKEDKRAALD